MNVWDSVSVKPFTKPAVLLTFDIVIQFLPEKEFSKTTKLRLGRELTMWNAVGTFI